MRSDIKNPNLIVRNGAYLFVRLLLVMAIAFYATRLTLSVLGDEDYGINNIIGGVISVFSIISMPITGALQRFFNVEFTRQEISGRVVFCTSLRIIAILAICMTVIYETIGLYLVNEVLKYPVERKFVVNVIFQITVLTIIFHFFCMAYSSLLFSKEDMGIPATVEIIVSVLKLLFLLFIPYVPVDRLITYTTMILGVSIFQFFFYVIYCWKKHEESRWTRQKDKVLQNEILKFAGWSSINSIAGISLTYLSNIFINMFGGVLYNTAYGIASQLSHAVVSFSTNVLKAVDPQITSSTIAEQDFYRNKVTLSAIKISFYGVGFCFVVFLFYGDYLLKLWLGHVPAYVFEFCSIALLNILFTSIVLPIRTIILATGKIRIFFVNYLIIAIVANVLMYVLLHEGWPIITVMYLIMAANVGNFVSAVIIVNKLSSLTVWSIVNMTIRIVSLLILAGAILHFLQKEYENTFIGFLISMAVAFMLTLIVGYFIAVDESEKKYIYKIVRHIRLTRK